MASVSNMLRFARALVVTNLRASLALRAAFWLQAAFMAANNLAFFATWWLLFERFDEIGGWRLRDLMTVYGVVAFGFGLAIVFGGGARRLARVIIDGELDSLLVHPKPVLLHAIGSGSIASGWGDMATGLGMLYVAGRLTPEGVPFVALAVLSSGFVFTAVIVTFQSLAFWLGETEQLARQMWEFTLTFALYPRTLFSGGVSFLLYTLVPAGFVGFLPVELVRAPSAVLCLAVFGGAVLWWAIAATVFAAGLRRYESGNLFGARG